MPKRRPVADHPELLALPEVRKLWQTEGLYSDHYLKTRLAQNPWWPADDLARPVWEFCRDLYNHRYLALARNNEAFTRQELLDPILARLGFAWTDNLSLPDRDAEPDYILFASAAEKEAVLALDTARRYRAAAGLLEAKKLHHPLSQLSRHLQRYPHQQIRDYLLDAQVLAWGILTNGNEWRLYCRDARRHEYFALNFEAAIQSLDSFKVFLALFSPAAFLRDAQGKCRLDLVREQAISAQTQLEEDLRQRVFVLLTDLAGAFSARAENLIPDTPEGLRLLYENCLIYLYRLLFVLYAEGRGLLPVEPRTRRYYKELSLERLKPDLKSFVGYDSQTRTRLGEDVRELFHLVNGTEPAKNEEYGVPRYNGGLFDPVAHPALETWNLADAALADVLRGLMFDPLPRPHERERPVQTVDFGDLRVQQLGSIYEGLLEHHLLRNATGQFELRTDKAERKATGTYYTPDYIVKYIVEQTLGPLLTEIEQRPEVKAGEADAFANAVLGLNVCDPAMGSGHFLVETTVHLAERIVFHPTTRRLSDKSKDEEEIGHWRRRVVEACVYGVDLNPLAVELAKLSLWLTCLAGEQPLSFLDHHLRRGNSLIGARLDQLGSLPRTKQRAETKQMRFTFGPDFRAAVAETIRQIQAIEGAVSRDVDAVKAKERRWQTEILPRLAPYKEVADLWTDTFFDGPLTEEAYLEKAALRMVAVQAKADELHEGGGGYHDQGIPKPYFHWELEFPEAFLSNDGSPKPNPGFDAVMGNPPWGADLSAKEKDFLRLLDTDTTTPNSYIYFVRRGETLARLEGRVGVVLPDSILVKDYPRTRGNLLHANSLNRIIYLDRAFKGVNHDSAILTFRRGLAPRAELRVGIVPRGQTDLEARLVSISPRVFDNSELEFRYNLNLTDSRLRSLFERLEPLSRMRSLGEFHEGIHTGNVRDKLFHRAKPSNACQAKPCLIGSSYGDEFGRYFSAPAGNWVTYDSGLIARKANEYASLREERIFIGPKLYVTRTGDQFFGFFDEDHYASNNLFSFKLREGRCESYHFVLALLNSKFAQKFNRLFLAPRFGDLFTETKILHLDLLPVPVIAFTTPAAKRSALTAKAKRLCGQAQKANDPVDLLAFVAEQLAAKPERADVVHDLLALLADRMAVLNHQKHAAVRQFHTDLRDFHGLDVHALTPKTRLDEFWTLETAGFFAHLRHNAKTLAAAKVDLRPTAEEKLRSRFEQARAVVLGLEPQLAFTDRLIDQIVYRLYGLTEDEIRVVEEA